MVPIAIIFPVPTLIWVGCISKWGKQARNVPKIFKRFPRHSVFMIPRNYSANPMLTQPDIQTKRTFQELFDNIWDVGGESEVWNKANPDQKHSMTSTAQTCQADMTPQTAEIHVRSLIEFWHSGEIKTWNSKNPTTTSLIPPHHPFW